jgi:hypothetical protein
MYNLIFYWTLVIIGLVGLVTFGVTKDVYYFLAYFNAFVSVYFLQKDLKF